MKLFRRLATSVRDRGPRKIQRPSGRLGAWRSRRHSQEPRRRSDPQRSRPPPCPIVLSGLPLFDPEPAAREGRRIRFRNMEQERRGDSLGPSRFLNRLSIGSVRHHFVAFHPAWEITIRSIPSRSNTAVFFFGVLIGANQSMRTTLFGFSLPPLAWSARPPPAPRHSGHSARHYRHSPI